MSQVSALDTCPLQLTRGLLWSVCALATLAAAAAQETETVLHSFGSPPRGGRPSAGVFRDPAGNLYGTATMGGTSGVGVIYKVDPAGHQTVLHNFSGGGDGGYPTTGLTSDSAGNLYGATTSGGTTQFGGVIFKLDSAGNETVLHSFTFGDGWSPYGGVIRDSAGNLYGTTSLGGSSGMGVVFKIDTSGNESTLYNFTGGADGGSPEGDLVRDSAGNLYGTASQGGASGAGVIFELDTSGAETVLHSFTGRVDGRGPYTGVIRDGAGNLYGTTPSGGASGAGVVFKLSPHRRLTVLHSFTGGADGGEPEAGLIRDTAGSFYGTTFSGGTSNRGVVFKLDAAGNQTVLYTFSPNESVQNPAAGLALDSAGNLYGTGFAGATGFGGVFELGASGQETVLYSFPSCADGFQPLAGLTLGADRNLYGTTLIGGTTGNGTVFKVGSNNHETVLHSFTTAGGDGCLPYGGIGLDSAGNIYGTTGYCYAPGGTVFKVDPSGSESVVLGFDGADGSLPYAGVTLDSAGNIYGTTSGGGASGAGTVYMIDTSGHETLLHSFTGAGDGGSPRAGVILDAAGNLYGTTLSGGAFGLGVVFKLDTEGQETVLHSFAGGADGKSPVAGVISDSEGNLYGTTPSGGASNAGVIFKIDASGNETVLYTFTGGADGGSPNGGLVSNPTGKKLNGTTASGGASGFAGTVFELKLTGQYSVLYSFCALPLCADGSGPIGTLVYDSSLQLFGTTESGGAQNGGVVFKIL